MRGAAILCALLLGGCAPNCQRDWYWVGVGDGRMSTGPQAAYHASYCGAAVDAARYDEGYRVGETQRFRPPA